jgi:hypothetical protein
LAWSMMRVSRFVAVALPPLIGCANAASDEAVRPRPVAEGAACDGVSDDTASLQAALDGGGTVAVPAGKVCRFTMLTVSVPVMVDLSGSTLRVRDGGVAGPFVRVTARGVTIRNGVIDGNRQRGARGWLVDWHGRDGRLEHVILQNGDSIGLSVTAAEASVVARNTTVRGFRGSVGVGFRVGAGSLVTDRCLAEGNEYAGYFVSQASPGRTVIDGVSTRNGIGALLEGARGGRVARLVSVDDDRFGLLLHRGASGWEIAFVEVSSTGKSAANPSGTGVELFQKNRHNVFKVVNVRGASGYGLAIAGDSDDNTYDTVFLDASETSDRDPGLVIAGGSDRNRLESVTVINHTVGVRFGENDFEADATNDNNSIGVLHVSGARHNAIRFEWGSGNRIGKAIVADSDSSGSDAHGFKGVVYFGNDSSDNVIGELLQVGTNRLPNYVVYAGTCSVTTCRKPATATGNRIDSGVARRWSRSAALDTVGGNVANLEKR